LIENIVYVESCNLKEGYHSKKIIVDGLDLVSVPLEYVLGKSIDYFIFKNSIVLVDDQDRMYLNLIDCYRNEDDQVQFYYVCQHSVHNMIRKIKVRRTIKNHSAFVLTVFNVIMVALLFAADVSGKILSLWVLSGAGLLLELYFVADFFRNYRKYLAGIKQLQLHVEQNFPKEQQKSILTVSKS
jgi:hypothetical protein